MPVLPAVIGFDRIPRGALRVRFPVLRIQICFEQRRGEVMGKNAALPYPIRDPLEVIGVGRICCLGEVVCLQEIGYILEHDSDLILFLVH